MMGRSSRDQGQLFYSFNLEDAVPDDHLVRTLGSAFFDLRAAAVILGGAQSSNQRLPSALKDDHLLRGHFRRCIGDAADAIAGLAAPGKWHPVATKGTMIVYHHRRSVEPFGCVEGNVEIARENARLKCDRQ